MNKNLKNHYHYQDRIRKFFNTVAIYLPRHFPVYELDNVQEIPKYYALSGTPDLSVVNGLKL